MAGAYAVASDQSVSPECFGQSSSPSMQYLRLRRSVDSVTIATRLGLR